MPVRDGYTPGVPCWVDASQPDPEAAVAFYGGLFRMTVIGDPEGATFVASTFTPENRDLGGRSDAARM